MNRSDQTRPGHVDVEADASVLGEPLPSRRQCGLGTAFAVGVVAAWSCLWLAPAAAQRWVVTEHRDRIQLFSEAPVNANSIYSQLTSLKSELQYVVDLSAATQPVEVIIFKSHANYQNYLRSSLPEALKRRAIFYRRDNTFQIYTWNNRELVKDLRHEYTHALLHQVLPFIPLWIDEGMAEYFEDQRGTRLKSSRFASVKWKARTGWKPSLVSLERIGNASQMTQQNYQDSWAWVAFLLNESQTSSGWFRQYLKAISAGEAPGAFSDYLAQRAPSVANGVGSYFRRIRVSLR